MYDTGSIRSLGMCRMKIPLDKDLHRRHLGCYSTGTLWITLNRNTKRPMHESTRVKAWIITSAVVLGLVALVAAPAVTAKSVTGNIISYRAGSGTTNGTLVLKTGTGNVVLKVPAKFDLSSLRRGRTVTVNYKTGKKVYGTYKSGPKKGKKFLVSVSDEVTKKPTVKNSGEGEGIASGEDTGGGGGGSENTSGGSGGSGTKPGA